MAKTTNKPEETKKIVKKTPQPEPVNPQYAKFKEKYPNITDEDLKGTQVEVATKIANKIGGTAESVTAILNGLQNL